MQLLDVLVALGYASTSGARAAAGKKRHLTYWAAPASAGLGFDVQRFGVAATPTTAVRHCADCGLSVLAMMLQRSTVRHVRSYLSLATPPVANAVETFVKTHVSPVLIQSSLAEVLAQSPDPASGTAFEPEEYDGDVSIAVNQDDRTVIVTFQKEEAQAVVKFRLPEVYPLKPAALAEESMRLKTRAGVPAEKWRSWLVKATVLLFGGGAGLWASVKLLCDNITKEFEGVEPCPICYAVVHATSHKLPDMSCVVCHNAKCHAACLHRWWGDSGQTCCPMCRSPWFSQ